MTSVTPAVARISSMNFRGHAVFAPRRRQSKPRHRISIDLPSSQVDRLAILDKQPFRFTAADYRWKFSNGYNGWLRTFN